MSFDATTFSVFGIPPYVFFAGIGALLAFFVFNVLMLHLRADVKLGNKAVVLAIPALFIGAKLFGIVANLVECFIYELPITYKTFLFSGIVFYGGLIFFVITFLVIMKKGSIENRKGIYDSLAVAIPLFHAFGRIGCFTAGCCYGTSNDGLLSVLYTNWVEGIVTTEQRVPIQLIEAFLNIGLFALLLLLLLNKKQQGKLLYIYFISYSIIRFIDEFFRDDIDKTILYGFSAAQLISVILLVFVSIKLIKERTKRNV